MSGLTERAVPGLHHATFAVVMKVSQPCLSIDLGAGTGAWVQRLRRAGYDVLACDRERESYGGEGEFVEVDLDDVDFASRFGCRRFGLVTAIEVIEHLESPARFLRNVATLLAPNGLAVITTPNLESLPARVKFLLTGRLRMMDRFGDPTHVAPVFTDILNRRLAPAAGLELIDHRYYPVDGFVAGRALYRRLLKPLGRLLARMELAGDNHIYIFRRSTPTP